MIWVDNAALGDLIVAVFLLRDSKNHARTAPYTSSSHCLHNSASKRRRCSVDVASICWCSRSVQCLQHLRRRMCIFVRVSFSLCRFLWKRWFRYLHLCRESMRQLAPNAQIHIQSDQGKLSACNGVSLAMISVNLWTLCVCFTHLYV